MNDLPPKPLSVRCKHCYGLTLVPASSPQPGRADADTAKLLEAKLVWLVSWITRSPNDPATVGKRVLQVELAMKRERKHGELLRLAKRLGVSHARASVAVADAEAQLLEYRSVTKAPPLAKCG